MKKFAIHALLFACAVLPLYSQSPEEIAQEYHARATQKLVKLNETLEREGAEIAAALISKGDTEGARQVSEQVKLKLEAQPVTTPHQSVETLFRYYNVARATELAPLKESSYKRLDSMLSSSGKDMTKVMEIGKAREQIQNDNYFPTLTPAQFMAKHRLPKEWSYYLTTDMDARFGTLRLNSDGTFTLSTRDPVSGTWEPTKNPQVLELKIATASGQNETSLFKMEGSTATFKRASGERFLRAQ